jgi:signal transduction histidine kinase/ligand-binding sensor domain-containing protein
MPVCWSVRPRNPRVFPARLLYGEIIVRMARRAGTAVGALLACCNIASALNPSLDINQYAHTSWRVRDGFFKGAVWAIAQTPDGYIWLGTEFGVLRFDGVRAVPWQPPGNQSLPSTDILSLLVARDGTLWIGTAKGLASWKDGRLVEQYAELAGQFVFRLLEDDEGMVWASAWALSNGWLCEIGNGSVQCKGRDGALGPNAPDLYEDSKHNFWAGVQNGLWRLKPGSPKFYSVPGEPDGIHGLAEDDDGALLIGTHSGIRRFVDGKTEPYRLSGTVQQFQTTKLLRDRDGGLWIGTSDRGVIHAHQRTADVFGPSTGLSGIGVATLFEDREGDIWVSTINGLDRFRNLAVATLTLKGGLSNTGVASVLAATDGSVWIATYAGLNRWKNGQISAFGGRDGKLNRLAPNSLFQDSHGRIWVSTPGAFGHLENDRFIAVNGIPGGSVHGIAEDHAGNLWTANQEHGLFRLSPRNEVQQIPWTSLGQKDNAVAIAADPLRGGLWVGFYQGGVVYFSDGQVRAAYKAANGLGDGTVNRFQFDPDGTVWAATEGGLSRLKSGRVATLTSKNGLPCDAVHWVIQDNDHAFWLFMACGLVRVARSEIDAWAAAVDRDGDSKRTIQAFVLDNSDGVTSQAIPYYYRPQVTESLDGKLWFVNLDGVSTYDPRHLPFNKVPPPVHIEQITADRKTYDPASYKNGYVSLPARVRDLAIDYTALSFVVSEKVHFRYKLEGQDPDWREVVNVRQAQYSNLPPRHYTFRVMASNNSGVWNETGASFDFSIAPAYYQTQWFRVSCVAVFLALLWGLYRYRLHQIAREFNVRMEERLGERTRIARELHDTLLQSFQGLMLRFQVAHDELPGSPAEARKTLEYALDEAAQAITEGRDAVQGLRSSAVESNDLARAIGSLGEELAGDESSSSRVESFVEVEGTPRDIHPILRDEIYRIAGEALRNAFRHAQARRINVAIGYGERQFRLRVRDDGTGIDPEVLDQQGRAGHWGLAGMRERAELIGGELEIWSRRESGTQVELSIPASLAYGKSPGRRFRLFARKTRTNA